jgi:hypothetical protein
MKSLFKVSCLDGKQASQVDIDGDLDGCAMDMIITIITLDSPS